MAGFDDYGQLSSSIAFTTQLVEQVKKLGGLKKFSDPSWLRIQEAAETGNQR